MKIIINSKKWGKHTILIDAEDFHRVNKYKWHLCKGPTTFYAQRMKKANTKSGKTTDYLHRLILKAKTKLIDHRNGNGLDCTKKNLRFCTEKQNPMNMRIPKHNTSGYKGVQWYKDKKKWGARIQVNKKHKFLGFGSIRKCAKLYNKAAKKYFGEFANFNQL